MKCKHYINVTHPLSLLYIGLKWEEYSVSTLKSKALYTQKGGGCANVYKRREDVAQWTSNWRQRDAIPYIFRVRTLSSVLSPICVSRAYEKNFIEANLISCIIIILNLIVGTQYGNSQIFACKHGIYDTLQDLFADHFCSPFCGARRKIQSTMARLWAFVPYSLFCHS